MQDGFSKFVKHVGVAETFYVSAFWSYFKITLDNYDFHNFMNTKPNSYLSFLDGHECCSYSDYKNNKATI